MITLLSSGIITPHIETETATVTDALDTDRINSGTNVIFSSSTGTPETVTINGITGEINAKEITTENVETETVNDEPLPIYLSSDLELTVGTGGDYATLDLALDDVYKKYKPCREYSKVILRIIDSTLPAFNYTIENIDMGFIEIRYVDRIDSSCVRTGDYLRFTTTSNHGLTVGDPLIIMPAFKQYINYAQFGTVHTIESPTQFLVYFTAHDYATSVNCVINKAINTPNEFIFTGENSKMPIFNLAFYSDVLNMSFSISGINSNMVFEDNFAIYNVFDIGGAISAVRGSNVVINSISSYLHPAILYISSSMVSIIDSRLYGYITSAQYGIQVYGGRVTFRGYGYMIQSGTGVFLEPYDGSIISLPDNDIGFTLTNCSIPYNTLLRDGIVFYNG
jgi:hypothetical protein